MGLMGRRAGCLRVTGRTGNVRDQKVLRIVASEVLSEDRARSDQHCSKGSKCHVLQRAKRRSVTPRPVTGFELVKQRIPKLEDQQREDGKVLIAASQAGPSGKSAKYRVGVEWR